MSTIPAIQPTHSPLPERYYLHTGAAAAPRLGLLHTIFGPGTEHVLRRAGIRSGMRVADIGCGVGHVTRFLADCVGPSGNVSAVDGSDDQLEVARQTTSGTTGRVDFVRASAYDTTLPRGAYDLVCCRFLLCHLQRPLDAIAEMRALLRPGGVLVCEDMEASTLTSIPETEIYARMGEVARQGGSRRGTDVDIGRRLPEYLVNRGFADVRAALWQPAYFEGEEKRFWEYSTLETGAHAVEAGLVTEQEIAERAAAMREINLDPAILLLLPRIWQVWGVKP